MLGTDRFVNAYFKHVHVNTCLAQTHYDFCFFNTQTEPHQLT